MSGATSGSQPVQTLYSVDSQFIGAEIEFFRVIDQYNAEVTQAGLAENALMFQRDTYTLEMDEDLFSDRNYMELNATRDAINKLKSSFDGSSITSVIDSQLYPIFANIQDLDKADVTSMQDAVNSLDIALNRLNSIANDMGGYNRINSTEVYPNDDPTVNQFSLKNYAESINGVKSYLRRVSEVITGIHD